MGAPDRSTQETVSQVSSSMVEKTPLTVRNGERDCKSTPNLNHHQSIKYSRFVALYLFK